MITFKEYCASRRNESAAFDLDTAASIAAQGDFGVLSDYLEEENILSPEDRQYVIGWMQSLVRNSGGNLPESQTKRIINWIRARSGVAGSLDPQSLLPR